MAIDGDVVGDDAIADDVVAAIGRRTPLPAFAGSNVGELITLSAGHVGDEGWFALKAIPSAWAAAGPTANGLTNFVGSVAAPFPHGVGAGLGTPDGNGDREALLDKVSGVTPLRATGLRMLVGRDVCALVWASDISIDYGPVAGSLKGGTLGVAAFRVVGVSALLEGSSGSLPKVQVRINDPVSACDGALSLLTSAPEPSSSSEPYDTGP